MLGPVRMMRGCNAQHHSLLRAPVSPPEGSTNSKKMQKESSQQTKDTGSSGHPGVALEEKLRVCSRIHSVKIINYDGTLN